MSGQPPVPNILGALECLEHARAVDFVRYVNRRLDEDATLYTLPFDVGFQILLGGYVAAYAPGREGSAA